MRVRYDEGMRSRILAFAPLLVISSVLVLPLIAHAAALPFFGPIIGNSAGTALENICPLGWGYLITVINNIIRLLLTLAIVFVAPLMIAYSGFLFVVNPVNPSGREEAKNILTHTVVGIVIALSGWLIVDAIMAVLYHPTGSIGSTWSQLITGNPSDPCLKQEGSVSSSASPSSAAAPALTVAQQLNPTSVSTPAPALEPPILPATPTQRSVAIATLDGFSCDDDGNCYTKEDGVNISTHGFRSMPETDGLKQKPPEPPYTDKDPIAPEVNKLVQQVIDEQIGSISEPSPTPPTPSPSSPISAQPTRINSVDPDLVKAIIQTESSNRKDDHIINTARDGKESLGRMQIRIDTAREVDKKALKNLSDAQVREKLLTDHVYNVKLGTAYLKNLSAKYDGDLNKIIAAYNGGPKANKASRDCSNSSRWQCEWDNKAHTIPNTGYNETRNYVTKVNQYYDKLKSKN